MTRLTYGLELVGGTRGKTMMGMIMGEAAARGATFELGLSQLYPQASLASIGGRKERMKG